MQPDTNETGRSMVEMLGVLAIIGVLSIGGIQGYTYAMNKYRANNVLNEINMASHQLATALVTSRNAQKMLSLGTPYDNGTMTTENYPFDYGCGNEGTPEQACQQAEQGYWVSVGGLTEKVCQNMLSETGFLPYVAGTQLNGETVTDGTNCAEEDNEIMFLFNADGSGELAENVGGNNGNSDDEDEPTPTVSCPENTSEDGVGGFATTLTDETTGKQIQCYCAEVDTKYTNGMCETLPETCNKNADCNRGEYCDITDYGSTYCTKDTSGMKGTCRNAQADLRNKPAEAPFWVSSHAMWWWSAKHFCEALGKTMVEVSDYDCDKTFVIGMGNGNCYISGTSTKTAKVEAMYQAYANGDYFHTWTNTDASANLCHIFHLGYKGSNVYVFARNTNNASQPFYAVCK